MAPFPLASASRCVPFGSGLGGWSFCSVSSFWPLLAIAFNDLVHMWKRCPLGLNSLVGVALSGCWSSWLFEQPSALSCTPMTITTMPVRPAHQPSPSPCPWPKQPPPPCPCSLRPWSSPRSCWSQSPHRSDSCSSPASLSVLWLTSLAYLAGSVAAMVGCCSSGLTAHPQKWCSPSFHFLVGLTGALSIVTGAVWLQKTSGCCVLIYAL